MTGIRSLVQVSSPEMEGRLPDLLKQADATRQEPGCVQAELFRGTEFAENYLYLECWESPAAFDAHRNREIAAGRSADSLLQMGAPNHYGTLQAPRRYGQNGLEIYPQALFARVGPAWGRANAEELSEYVRWPAIGAVRILFQSSSDPNTDPAGTLRRAVERRNEPGCLQWEHFRSIDFAENTASIELFSDPEIYDRHWFYRMHQIAEAERNGAPPEAAPYPRRYGAGGLEMYQHRFYTLVDDTFYPEDPAQRMLTIRW